jgi:hypothetical protein
MFIRIHMTRDELSLAAQAVGMFDDSQHDMGADEGWGFDVIDATLQALDAMIGERADAMDVRFDIRHFALICDAVEVYFTDPSDIDDPDTYMAQKALADRLAAFEDRTIDLD